MLNQENAEEQTAATVCVTPEELVAAVADLEARKQGTPDALAIGDAVAELSLTHSPEDILREVQARRERENQRLRFAAKKRKWTATLSLSLLCLMGFGIYSAVSSGNSNDTHAEWGPLIPSSTPFAMESRILALDPASPRHTISTLAEVPEGETVYCSGGAIETAAMCRNRQWGTEREVAQTPTDLNWPIVKHGRDVFVRGWIKQPLSKEAAKISDVQVFNKPNFPLLGPSPQQVTFKLDMHISFVGLGGQMLNADGSPNTNGKGTFVFVFHNPRLTDHTYEKWSP